MYFDPVIDILETDRHTFIVVDLPGVSPEDLKIAYMDSSVFMSGKRELPKLLKGAQYKQHNIPKGEFTVRLEIPEGHAVEKVQVEYNNGVLYMRVPKMKARKTSKKEGEGK